VPKSRRDANSIDYTDTARGYSNAPGGAGTANRADRVKGEILRNRMTKQSVSLINTTSTITWSFN